MQKWWDINVNDALLVTVKGKSSAEFMLKYLEQDTKNDYSLVYSIKNKEPVEPITPEDIIAGKI